MRVNDVLKPFFKPKSSSQPRSVDGLHSRIHVFGKTKINLRQLVIFNCHLDRDKPCSIVVSRAYRGWSKKVVELEDANVKAEVFLPSGTVHLNDIFLSEHFGVSIAFQDQSGAFVQDTAQGAQEWLDFRTGNGKEIRLMSYVQASPVR